VWRDKILCGIGDNASVMVNIFPQLRLIIGDRPVAPELPPAERERRFNFVFQSFIRVFAGEDHPLVLFLDDLQNVDRPSLNCLEIILNDAMLKNFMFIGSFRSNEVAGIHPLKSFMAGLEKENIKWKKINLLPLSGKDINSLVSATLLREDTGKLAESIVNKTGGNPFFVNEFLKTLYENGWITYSGGWQYDIKTIESTKITDNIVELMVEKIKRVPAMTLELLKTASCTGNKFYFDTLSQLFNRTEFETMEILKPAIDEGMIIKIGNTARFSHDRVQEAVFSLTTEHERLKNHYLLGKALLENTLPDQKENRLFTIIGHLNYAVSIISDPHERLILAWMNLAAGIKAKSSTAYEQACLFFDTGIMLLPENPWKNEYRLTLALYSEGGEAMYLAGKNQGAEEYFETVLTNAVEPLDKVKIYSIQVPLHTENSRRDKAIELGRKALALLGVNLPEKSNPFILIIELMKASRMVKRLVKNKNADSLLELPHVSDHVKLAVSQILMSITTPAYISNPDYYPLIALKLLNYTLKNGNSAYSAFAYVVYGLILISTFGKYDAGFQFGRLALKLGEIIDTKSVQSKVNFLFGNLINHWKRPIRENIPFLENGYRAGMETGDIQFASYCINHMLGNLIVSGENLEIVKDRASEFSSVMKKIMQVDTQQYFNMFYQIVISLIKNTGTLSSIKGDLFDEDLIVPELQKTKNLTVLGFYTFWKEYLCYLYGDYEGCIGFAAEGNNYLDSISGMPYYKEYFYYQALALLGALPAAGKKQSNVYLRIVKNNLKKIRKWAIQCPENCLHKQFFIEAEINAVSGRKDIAMKLYDSAVETAHRNGFINEEAMILERASVFYDQEGMEKVSSVYLKEAFSAYKIWGAGAKLRQLFEKHPDILPSPEAIEETAGKSESSSESSTVLAPLDLSSVMKAASAISGEIKMDKLLGRLVKIAMENAGAQKTVIVLFWKGVLNVEAVGNSGSDEIERPYNANIDESLVVPASIIRYVARKKQSIVIDDAYHESAYSRDEYIHDNRVRSVLCQPIVNKGLVIGVIYMENNLSTGAFTKERLQIMNILSGQMGISIDNAGLYDKLESYSKNLEIMVEERTLQLKEVNRELSRRYETMARELRVAHTIQQAIIPDVFPEIPWLSLAGRYIPMEELGGDFYDLFYLDKNIVSIIIADVSGHGVPAALITAMAKISFNSNAVKGKSAGDTIELVNRELCKAIEELMQYLSAFYCIIDMDKKELEYCNAGHVEIMLQRDEKTIIELPPNSPVIGYKTDYEFNSTSVKIMPGDRLVLFTDGIPEARDDESKFYGMDRFIKTLQKNRRQTPEIMVDNIFKDIGDFTMKSPARDDITLLVADILDKN
jgi:predicted ATPase/serine phosphatase RsbU (regulator of sigma subunit)